MSRKNDINYILKDINNKQFFLINYLWFKDYYKIINAVFSESVLRYNPSKETRYFIELTAVSNTIIAVVKVPIIKTNIETEFISKIKHNIFFSKYNNDIIALIFDNNTITVRHNYTTKNKYIELNNKNYYSLSFINNFKNSTENKDEEDEEEEELEDKEKYMIELDNDIEEKNIEEFNNKNKALCYGEYVNCFLLMEENFNIDKRDKIFQTINDNIIKNVICYLNIEFDNLKDIFKKLGNGKINIIIKKNTMYLKSIIPKYNKQINLEVSIIHLNKSMYDKEISFFINSNAITKLKSLTSNFNIISSDNKKIFKIVEMKVVMDSKDKYGITIFPGNFTDKNRINDNIFDIYNSILLYIPEHL